MKLIYLSALTLTLVACSSEGTQEIQKEIEEVAENLADTLQTEIIDEVKTLADYKMEDYAMLKSYSAIEDAFGENNVEAGSSWFAEGTVEMKHAIANNPDNGQIVKYLLDDDGKTVNSIEFSYKVYDEDFVVKNTQKIESKEGIYTGMPIKDLLAWNENVNIEFAGFAWDYHGFVNSGKGGPNSESKLAKSMFDLQMDVNDEIPSELIGDVMLSTKDPKVLNADILVGTITMNLNKTVESDELEEVEVSTMDFDSFFVHFQEVVKNKDIEELKQMASIGTSSSVKLEELINQFDTFFRKEVVKKLLSTKSSDLKNVKNLNGEYNREFDAYVEYHEEGDTLESFNFFYFDNTNEGWKLVSITIGG